MRRDAALPSCSPAVPSPPCIPKFLSLGRALPSTVCFLRELLENSTAIFFLFFFFLITISCLVLYFCFPLRKEKPKEVGKTNNVWESVFLFFFIFFSLPLFKASFCLAPATLRLQFPSFRSFFSIIILMTCNELVEPLNILIFIP